MVKSCGAKPLYDKKVHPARVIEIMTEGASIVTVCKEFGITRATHYNWKAKYPEYREAVEHGEIASQAWWEENLKKGATGKISFFNSNACAFAMKSRFEDYREKAPESVTNNLIVNLTEDQLQTMILQKAKNTGLLEDLKDLNLIDLKAEKVEYVE